jgi:hypothetical protein
MSKEPARHSDDKVAPKSNFEAAVKQTAEDRAQPADEEGFIPNYHGYNLTQIKRMEDARYDDTTPPPPVGAPKLTSIDPDTAEIGGPDLTLTATGSGFGPDSYLTFNGGQESTVHVDANTLTTIVKPSTATLPGTYPVTVVNAFGQSTSAGFTFTQSAARASGSDWGSEAADPDELEDEIEQAEEEGEFKSTHAKPKTKTKR